MEFLAYSRWVPQTLTKQEEIHANRYRDLDHLRSNVAEFIERYYNAQRLHSALGYQSPNGFEQSIEPAVKLPGVKVSFTSFNPMDDQKVSRPKTAYPPVVLMSLRPAIPCRVGLHQSPTPRYRSP